MYFMSKEEGSEAVVKGFRRLRVAGFASFRLNFGEKLKKTSWGKLSKEKSRGETEEKGWRGRVC